MSLSLCVKNEHIPLLSLPWFWCYPGLWLNFLILFLGHLIFAHGINYHWCTDVSNSFLRSRVTDINSSEASLSGEPFRCFKFDTFTKKPRIILSVKLINFYMFPFSVNGISICPALHDFPSYSFWEIPRSGFSTESLRKLWNNTVPEFCILDSDSIYPDKTGTFMFLKILTDNSNYGQS